MTSRDDKKTARLRSVSDRLREQLRDCGYVDDAEAFLYVDLAFVAIEAIDLSRDIPRLADARRRTTLLRHAYQVKWSLEHLLFHASTAVPRLGKLIDLLEDQQDTKTEEGA